MGTPLGPKYIPYTYMDPLGIDSWETVGGSKAPSLTLENSMPRADP